MNQGQGKRIRIKNLLTSATIEALELYSVGGGEEYLYITPWKNLSKEFTINMNTL